MAEDSLIVGEEEYAMPPEEVEEDQVPQFSRVSSGYLKDKVISRRRTMIRSKVKKRVIISNLTITKDSTMIEDMEVEIPIKTSPSIKRKEEKEEMKMISPDRKRPTLKMSYRIIGGITTKRENSQPI